MRRGCRRRAGADHRRSGARGSPRRVAHNWAVLHRLDALLALQRPVLVGASRKRFLGELVAPDARDDATAAVSALAAAAACGVCVCTNPSASRAAVEVGTAWRRGG